MNIFINNLLYLIKFIFLRDRRKKAHVIYEWDELHL
jgi:hypothetical protein